MNGSYRNARREKRSERERERARNKEHKCLNCLNNSFLFVSYDNCRVNAFNFCAFLRFKCWCGVFIGTVLWNVLYNCKNAASKSLIWQPVLLAFVHSLYHLFVRKQRLQQIKTESETKAAIEQSDKLFRLSLMKEEKIQLPNFEWNKIKRYGNSYCLWHPEGKVELHHECALCCVASEMKWNEKSNNSLA